MTLIFSLIICGQTLAQSGAPAKSCAELHYDQSMNKMIKAKKIRNRLIFGGAIGFSVFGIGAAVTGGYAALAALSSVSSNIAWGSLGLTAAVGLTPRKSQAAQIQAYADKEAHKLKRKIRRGAPDISDAEIETALKDGYQSGEFCPDNRLLSLKEISASVIKKHNPSSDCSDSQLSQDLSDLEVLDDEL